MPLTTKLFYLYHDKVSASDYVLQQYRDFMGLVRQVAPEHADRILQERLLSHISAPSLTS